MTVASSSKMDSNTTTRRSTLAFCTSCFFLTLVISGRIRTTEDDGCRRLLFQETRSVSDTTMIEGRNESQQLYTTCAAKNITIDSDNGIFLDAATPGISAPSSSPSSPPPTIPPLLLDLKLLYNIYLTNESPLTMNYTATKSLMEFVGRGLHEAIVSIAMPCRNHDNDNGDGTTTGSTPSYYYTMTTLSTRPDEYEIRDFGCDSDVSVVLTRDNASATSQVLSTVANDVVVACHQVSTVINATLLYLDDAALRNDDSGGRGLRQQSNNQNLRSNERRLVIPNDALVQLTEWLETAFEVVSSKVVGSFQNDGESATNNGVAQVTFKGFLDLAAENLGGGATGELTSKQDSPDALNDSVLTQSNLNAGIGIDWGSYGLPIMLAGAVAMSIFVIGFLIQRRRNLVAFEDHINNLSDPDDDDSNDLSSVDKNINELDTTPQSTGNGKEIDANGDQQLEGQHNSEHRDIIMHRRDTGVTIEDAIISTQDLNLDYRGKHRLKEQQQVKESDKYSGIEKILMKLFCWESN